MAVAVAAVAGAEARACIVWRLPLGWMTIHCGCLATSCWPDLFSSHPTFNADSDVGNWLGWGGGEGEGGQWGELWGGGGERGTLWVADGLSKSSH